MDLGIQAARITRLRDGKIYAADCILHYCKPVSIEKAIALVKDNKIAFVAREDAKAVLAGVSN